MDHMDNAWGIGLGWLIPLLIIGLLIYLVPNNQKGRSYAQDILDKRYANGEIDEAEYKKKSQDIQE